MSEATLTLYGGVGTIGGTKLVVAEGGYRAIVDFGAAFMPGAPNSPFDHLLLPRPGAAGLRDLLAVGALPRLDGLYPPVMAAAAGLQGGADGQTAVFISHLHLDHMSFLDYLDPDLPVHLSADSERLLRALAASGETQGVHSRLVAWQPGAVLSVGPLRLRPLPVDHDVIGASAFLIEIGAGCVAYSGDLRLHGAHPELTRAFAAAVAAAAPAALLLEGTRLGLAPFQPEDLPPLAEPDVAARLAELTHACPGLVLVNFYRRNVERIAAFAAAARQAGRTLLLSPESAYVLQACTGGLQGCGIFLRETLRSQVARGLAPAWVAPLVRGAVSTEAVRKDQNAYVLELQYPDLPELVDLAPAPGSLYVHSNGEPFGRDSAFNTLLGWLERSGLTYVPLHCSGHAQPADLQWIATTAAPQTLLPIHSRAPQELAPPGISVRLPELGVTYPVASLTGRA